MRPSGASEFGFTTTNGPPNRVGATLGATRDPTATQQGCAMNVLCPNNSVLLPNGSSGATPLTDLEANKGRLSE
jgi:hypothetical protein